MKFKYYPETDTLYIETKDVQSVESEEILEGIVLDYDEDGNIVGIEIEGIKNLKNLDLPIKAKFELYQSSK
ncbi:DUF2283 domain-containing protein [Venenivibrio stagnispumantis]|uniref:Uncharacterized protein YuzE n=1 Tax=Venenivibrio stagnispumantis TaxID=407998 RepID=A0AA45WJX7_9AQUI|nr:DUF2283 domain-containing protein [Venenivibrio stagnispumantis]MCW4572943.1 DUF2283 domain-containing protein [Venenivibrio stagnispumantis]SMP04827.1 Uncharacterized protein YuzE [Venenivibrio stagnispumantis]